MSPDFKTELKAAEQGDANSQLIVGCLYDDGAGIPRDIAEAMKWWHKAAEQGNAEAQLYLGVMYGGGDDGVDVVADHTEAVKWYRKSAEQGNSQAQFSLGGMYLCGEGVPKDDTEFYVWTAVAAANGHADAEYILSAASKYLTPGQLAAADQRVAELTEQINANKAK